MKVKMHRTCFGSPDGMRVDEYQKGATYDLPEELARVFLKQRWATPALKKSRRTKDMGAAPENKTVQTKMKRKTRHRGGEHGA